MRTRKNFHENYRQFGNALTKSFANRKSQQNSSVKGRQIISLTGEASSLGPIRIVLQHGSPTRGPSVCIVLPADTFVAQNSLGCILHIVIYTRAVPKPAHNDGLTLYHRMVGRPCATTSVSMETLIVQNSGPLMRNFRFTGRRPTWPHVSLEFSLLFANDLKGFKVR